MFQDRAEAGQKLAKALKQYEGKGAVVYALPRGGVVVAAEVAKELDAPLDLVIARKIGHPSSPEFAIGAVTETGDPVWDEIERPNLSTDQQQSLVKQEREEAKRRRIKYVGKRQKIDPKDKTAILVDDGIATGLTMMAAIEELRGQEPAKIVAAVPVAPSDVVLELKEHADTVVILNRVPGSVFGAVGSFYKNFDQTEDSEVQDIMAEFH